MSLTTLAVLALTTWSALGTSPAPAAEPAGVDTSRVIPFVNSETAAIVRIDPARFSLDDALALAKRVGLADVVQPAQIGAFAGALAEWKAAGAREAYLVVNSLRPQAPLLVVPFPADGDRGHVRKMLRTTRWNVFAEAEAEGVLLAGDAETIAATKATQPAAHPHMAAALASLKPAALSLVLAPSADHRRVLAETLVPGRPERERPVLQLLLAEMKWMTLALDASPRLEARVEIQTSSPEAATQLQSLIKELLSKLAASPEVQAVVPRADELVGVFSVVVEGDRVAWRLAEGDVAFDSLLKIVEKPLAVARATVKRRTGADNLKHLALAFHNYHAVHKHLPAAGLRGEDGRPLLSWRVLVLPFVGADELYKQFRLNEPWDSEHNKQLIGKMPTCFQHPLSSLPSDSGKTNYLAVTGPGTAFGVGDAMPFSSIRDGLSNTILVVEVSDEHAVIWTKPEDWEFHADEPLRRLGGLFDKGFYVMMADGAVRFVSNHVDAKKFAVAFTASGQENPEAIFEPTGP